MRRNPEEIMFPWWKWSTKKNDSSSRPQPASEDQWQIERDAERNLLKSLPNGQWGRGWPPGVLLADQICRAVDEFVLIAPFDSRPGGKGRLRPAGYELTVGRHYSINGEIRTLRDGPIDNEIVLRPFDVAVIETQERLNVPEFMIARWNVTVGRAYEGLLWVGAAQVDPGFKGFLCCPIYNLSDRERRLKFQDPIAVIDFVVTTPPTLESHKYSIDFTNRKRIIFEDYRPNELQSALITHAQNRLDEFRKGIEKQTSDISEIRTTVFNSLGILLTAIGALVTALALFVGRAEPKFVTYLSPPLLVAFAALIVALGSLVTVATSSRLWRTVCIMGAVAVVIIVMYWIAWYYFSLPSL
jgi:deoxycytidine triphosphate deaminase